MGSSDRDYFRNRPLGRDPLASWNVIKWLIIANVVIYILQILIVGGPNVFGQKTSLLTQWLSLNMTDLEKGQIWRLLTYGFCHSRVDLFHILFNMLFLWWFGRRLEQLDGSREFLTFYLTSIVAAGVAYIGLGLVTGLNAPVIGASGGVMAVLAVFAMRYPEEKIYIWMILPVKVRWILIAYLIFDLHPVLLALAGEAPNSGVAHAAHLGGLAFGFAYWKWNWKLEPLLDRFPKPGKRSRGAPAPRPVLRSKVNLPSKSAEPKVSKSEEQKIDALLEKINQKGLQSLTDKERKLLEKASQDIRKRR